LNLIYAVSLTLSVVHSFAGGGLESAQQSAPSLTPSLFQVFAVVLAAAFFVMSIAAIFRGWATRREGGLWAIVWLAAGLAIASPDLTVHLAGFLGIGRGADLVLYCAVIVMLIGFFMVYARLRRLRRDLTLLSRHVAIRDAAQTTLSDRPTAPQAGTK